MNLNLGGGYTRIKGFKNVDFRKETKPDYLINLEKKNCLKPIKSNTVDEIYAGHTFEHIRFLSELMEEIYRVCKNGAKVTIRVPYWSHQSAVEDPTHIRYFTEKSMMYYSKDTIGSDGQKISIPYDFVLKSVALWPTPEYVGVPVPKLKELAKKYLNVISQVEFTLIVKK